MATRFAGCRTIRNAGAVTQPVVREAPSNEDTSEALLATIFPSLVTSRSPSRTAGPKTPIDPITPVASKIGAATATAPAISFVTAHGVAPVPRGLQFVHEAGGAQSGGLRYPLDLGLRDRAEGKDSSTARTSGDPLAAADSSLQVQWLRAGQLGNAVAHVALLHPKGDGLLSVIPKPAHDRVGNPGNILRMRPGLSHARDGGSELETLRLSEGGDEALGL